MVVPLSAAGLETHLGLSGDGLGLRGGGVRGTAGLGAMLAAGRKPWMMLFCTNETQGRSLGGGDNLGPCPTITSQAEATPGLLCYQESVSCSTVPNPHW